MNCIFELRARLRFYCLHGSNSVLSFSVELLRDQTKAIQSFYCNFTFCYHKEGGDRQGQYEGNQTLSEFFHRLLTNIAGRHGRYGKDDLRVLLRRTHLHLLNIWLHQISVLNASWIHNHLDVSIQSLSEFTLGLYCCFHQSNLLILQIVFLDGAKMQTEMCQIDFQLITNYRGDRSKNYFIVCNRFGNEILQ